MKKLISALLLLCTALMLTACLGPKPVLKSYTLNPPTPGSGEPYTVEFVLANEGPGGGEVEVEVSLTNKQTGEVIAQKMEEVELEKDATVRKQIELDLPDSLKNIDPGQVEVQVDAHYPIQ